MNGTDLDFSYAQKGKKRVEKSWEKEIVTSRWRSVLSSEGRNETMRISTCGGLSCSLTLTYFGYGRRDLVWSIHPGAGLPGFG